MPPRAIVGVVLVMVLFISAYLRGETIVLKDGKSITGRIVEEADTYVKVSTTSAVMTIGKDRIERIDRDRTISREEQDGDRALQEGRLEDALRQYTAASQAGASSDALQKKLASVMRRIEERDARKYGEIFDKIAAFIAEKKFDSARSILDALEKEADLAPSVSKKINNRKARIFYAEAEEALNRIDYGKAEAQLRAAIREEPEFFEARLLYAKLLDKNPARRSEALEQYLAGLTSGGSEIAGDDRCGYHFAIASIYFDRGDFAKALQHLEEIHQLSTTRFAACKNMMVDVYMKLSELAIKQDFQKGIGYLREALKVDPVSENVRMTLAMAYMDRGFYKEAVTEFKEVVQRFPWLREVHYDMAICYDHLEMYEDARREYQAELKINPQHYNALCSLGEHFLNGGDYAGAQQYFTRAIEVSPERYRAYLGLGRTDAKMGHYLSAKTNLQKVLDAEPNHREAFFLMGMILKEEKDYTKAHEFFDKVVTSIQEHADTMNKPERQMLIDALIRRGEIDFLQERPRTALGDFQEALKYQPDNAEPHYQMGRVYEKLANHTEAERFLKKAIEINPKDPRYYLSLGIIYQNNLKDLKKAVEHYTQYILLGGPDVVTVNKWIEECGGKPIFPSLRP